MAVAAVPLIVGGLGAFQAFTQIQGAKQQAKSTKQAGEYNALLYEQQASMIESQKKIEEYQYNRKAVKLRGAATASAAGRGLLMSGSPLASMIDNETQLEFDKNIGQYNLNVQASQAKAAAAMTRYQSGQEASYMKKSGYMNAFSTILNTGANMAMMSMGPKVPKTPGRL